MAGTALFRLPDTVTDIAYPSIYEPTNVFHQQ